MQVCVYVNVCIVYTHTHACVYTHGHTHTQNLRRLIEVESVAFSLPCCYLFASYENPWNSQKSAFSLVCSCYIFLDALNLLLRILFFQLSECYLMIYFSIFCCNIFSACFYILSNQHVHLLYSFSWSLLCCRDLKPLRIWTYKLYSTMAFHLHHPFWLLILFNNF